MPCACTLLLRLESPSFVSRFLFEVDSTLRSISVFALTNGALGIGFQSSVPLIRWEPERSVFGEFRPDTPTESRSRDVSKEPPDTDSSHIFT